MSSILLEPIIPNLTKVGGSGEQLRDLWKLFTKVKDSTQGGRRLENLYWRLWYQTNSTGQLPETQKISSLFETWRGPGEDFRCAAAAIHQKRQLAAAAVAVADADAANTANTASAVATAPTSAAEAGPATTEFRSSPPQTACTSVDAGTASCATGTVDPASGKEQTTSALPSPAPPSIHITRVNSALKAMAAAAAAAVAPPPPVAAAGPPAATLAPTTEPNPVPAAPMAILPKKNSASSTPSKLSVGFVSDTKVTPRTTPAPKPPHPVTIVRSQSKTSIGFETTPSTASAPAQPIPSNVAAAPPPKKFFINSLSSVSSEESLNELVSATKTLPPSSFLTGAPSANAPQPNPPALFNKVAPPPEEPPEKATMFASNLSNLLKNPRRPAPRNTNILTTSQYFTRRRDAEAAPQYFESESLRRGLQIDRKPLIDPSLAYGGDTPMTYSQLPAAW